MEYYLDIHLLPDPEFSEQELLNALFAKFHRAMNNVAQGQVAVSFPKVAKRLGGTLRLHGSKSALDVLMTENWLQGMKDYCQCSGITAVPATCQYRTVKRVQAKSAYNKRKRSVTKGWLTAEEAEKQIPDSQQRKLNLPYLEVKSLSNGNRMRVYVEHGSLQTQPQQGILNSYGLSSDVTVPWF